MVDIKKSTFARGLGRPVSELPRSLVEKQDIYARGLVRFDKATNNLVNTATGMLYGTLEEAIEDTATLGISEVNIFTGSRGVLSPDSSGFGPLSDLTYNINEYLRLDNPEAKAFKSRHAVLSSLEGKNIELVRIGYSDTTGETVSQMAQLYNDQISFPDLDVMAGGGIENRLAKGEILPPGYLASRDGSSILLRLRYQTDEGYKYLSGEETVSLFNTLDTQFINMDRLAKLIDPLNPDGSMNLGKNAEQILGNQIGKAPKRQWQSLVERNMVIDQEGIGKMVDHLSTRVNSRFKDVAPKTLEDSYLFFDPALETTLKAFGLEESYTNTLLGDASLTRQGRLGVLRERLGTRIAMEGETAQSAQQYFRSALELQGLTGDDEFNQFAGIIQSQFKETFADKKNQKISLDDIISRIERISGGEGVPAELKGKYQRYIHALGEMKKIDDGSGFITGVPMRQHAESLRSSIKEAEAILSANTYAQGSDEAMQLTGNITSFKTQLDRIVTNSDDFLDGGKLALREFKHDTARMFIGRGQGKSVFDLIQGKVEQRLARLGFIGAGSTELLKKEISFARLAAPGSEELGPHVGQQITMQINTGHGRDMVYSEPQAMIFHREQYGQDFRRQVNESAQVLEGEIQNISEGIVSERLRRSILNDAGLDLEGMDIETLVERFGSRENAIRIRTNARNLQQVLSSGSVRVNEIPEVANQLLNQAQRDAFRTGKTYRKFVNGKVQDMPIFNYAMPYAQRQAIDTEGRISRGVGSKVLGVTDDTTFNRFTSASGDELSLFKFRHVGHKMLIPDIASSSLGLYEAGGGFDLDDKWITNLQSVKNSQGVRQLVSFAWRQPTGPQEFALLSPHLDEDTIMRMFGDETQMGQRFRGVSNAVSEMINDRTGFVLDLSSDLSGQPSALGMEQLSKEEKIFKYLNSLAHGQDDIARQFKQSAGDVTQEDLQRAIFKLVDLNGEGETGKVVNLFDGEVGVNVDDFANEYMGAGGKGVSAIKHKFLNIGGTSESILKKAGSTSAGTMLKLNADEILESGDAGLIASYRQSNLTQIMRSSAAPKEDKIFASAIEEMYDSRVGAGSYREAFNRISRESTDRSMTPMEFAIRLSGRMYKSSLENGEEALTMRS
jgi:hypothetical protein